MHKKFIKSMLYVVKPPKPNTDINLIFTLGVVPNDSK